MYFSYLLFFFNKNSLDRGFGIIRKILNCRGIVDFALLRGTASRIGGRKHRSCLSLHVDPNGFSLFTAKAFSRQQMMQMMGGGGMGGTFEVGLF